jgi:arabinose-5-phosphate isomerase
VNSDQLIKDIAQQTIIIEQEALAELSASLNDNFVAAVNCIFNSDGRIVLTGIGKSALVAQKVAATLNSTGTPALFMHAGDAVHGDLGMLKKEDILWCISKSGNTAEIKVLLPLIKQFGNPIIGFASDEHSYLAKKSDYFIHIPIEKEADPNNLAPTASTTSQMVMGDAIAMSLLALKGFSRDDFSKFHPGGLLGKQLYLKVEDLYPNNGKPSVKTSDSLKVVIMSMTNSKLGITVVVNDNGCVRGVITDGDLRRMLEKTSDIGEVKAADIMTPHPISIHDDALAVEALTLLREKSITQLIVVEGEEYKGIIHLHDLLREGII